MNRTLAILCTGAALILGGWVAEGVRVGTETMVGAVPPRFHTTRPPTYQTVSGIRVARDPEANGMDAFEYEGRWYVSRSGSWFRSRTYEGPYEIIGFEEVPLKIRRLPSSAPRRLARF